MTVATPLALVSALAAERMPLTDVKLMVSPLTTLLLASVTVARMVLVLIPSADKLFGLTETETAVTGPATKVTVVVSLTPPEVAVTVAVPRLVALVRVKVATPFVVVAVAAERVPAVVMKLTEVPSAILFPVVSFTLAVMSVEEVPSATMLELPGVTLTEPTFALIIVIVSDPVVPFVDVAVTVSDPPAGIVLGAV